MMSMKPVNGPTSLAFQGKDKTAKSPKVFEVIAHRGARTLADESRIAPENTIPAFQEAARLKTSVELDVIATKDGVVVVHHDDDTGRVFSLPGGEKRVTSATFDQIRAAGVSVAGHEQTVKKMLGPNRPYTMNAAFASEKIPTLEAVLDAIPDTHVYVELKTDTANPAKNNDLERRVVKMVQDKNLYDRVTIISFCQGSLRKVKKLDPKIKTGLDYLLPKPLKKWAEGVFLTYCKKVLKVDSVHPPYQEVTESLVRKAHKRGLTLMPWVYHETRDDEARLFPKLVGTGIDGIMTNAVDLFQTFQANNPMAFVKKK